MLMVNVDFFGSSGSGLMVATLIAYRPHSGSLSLMSRPAP